MTRRLAVLGGTFDPPHLGHLVVANEIGGMVDEATGERSFDEVILMVANDPWQKRGNGPITAAAVRLEMVRAALAGHARLVAGDDEIGRGGATYTIDTIEGIVAAGDVECTLVLGADAVAGLDTWHRAPELAALVDIVSVERPGHSPSAPSGIWTVRPVDVPSVDLSSTDIRDRCRRGAPIDFLVPEPVRSIIEDRGLYGVRR